jgi:predicted Zn-dependent protease
VTGDGPRIDELRRRVEKDPASIAFASLAEELRRTGQLEEAVRVCRAGLEHHPTYLSGRLTLGRSLLELEQYPEARTELAYVLNAAPDNLLAMKCMSELQERAGELPAAAAGFAQSPAEPEHAPEPLPVDPALEDLEAWHARIQADRARRSAGSPSHDHPR